jgi:signal transduction histidine kinase
MRDVTERKRDEDSWRFLAEASAVLGWSLDTESTLRAVARLAVPQIADWCVVELADHPPASTPELHARALRARTEEIWVDARMPGLRSLLVAPIQIQDQVHGAFLFATSEAGRRYDEQDLILAREIGRRAALAVENSRLFREARDAIRTRDEFLSVAAHELRTPLTTLRLHAETIQRHARLGREPMSDKLVDKVGRIVRQTYRLQELINSLLDVARISQGRLELTREADLDLAELAREIAGRFAEQLEEAGCVLTLDVEPARGNWDRLRLDGVITNLLTNAMKYGKGKPIEMTVRAGVSSATLSVADHGIGIAPEDQQRIFGRFERAVSGHHYGGMGLGLWITGQIVEAHGGAITVQSSAGAGARFTVELPL